MVVNNWLVFQQHLVIWLEQIDFVLIAKTGFNIGKARAARPPSVCSSNLVVEKVNKPMLVEDGKLPLHTERGRRRYEACAGAPPRPRSALSVCGVVAVCWGGRA